MSKLGLIFSIFFVTTSCSADECQGKPCGEVCELGVCDGYGFCVSVEENPCVQHGCEGKLCGDDCLIEGDILGSCDIKGNCDPDVRRAIESCNQQGLMDNMEIFGIKLPCGNECGTISCQNLEKVQKTSIIVYRKAKMTKDKIEKEKIRIETECKCNLEHLEFAGAFILTYDSICHPGVETLHLDPSKEVGSEDQIVCCTEDITNGPVFNQQWTLTDLNNNADINAAEGWKEHTTDLGQASNSNMFEFLNNAVENRATLSSNSWGAGYVTDEEEHICQMSDGDICQMEKNNCGKWFCKINPNMYV